MARQYCGALGKIANCQVATTVALWTGVRAWFLGATLYLPDTWLTAEGRQQARIPSTVRFQEKWRHALTLLRQVRAAGFELTAVIGDAEFGDVTMLRAALHRLRLPYALGISSTLTGDSHARQSSSRPQREDIHAAMRDAPDAPAQDEVVFVGGAASDFRHVGL